MLDLEGISNVLINTNMKAEEINDNEKTWELAVGGNLVGKKNSFIYIFV